MNNFPDFSENGYKIIEELGHNSAGGRVTYLASLASTDPPPNLDGVQKGGDREDKVVIKEFQFAKSSEANWAEYEAYEREIQVLQGLDHPGIPRYLDSFETARGFCLVQEYKDAQSLAVTNSWLAEDIKKIAIALLEILVYLQQRIPPVFHRDIKPENILVDGNLNVYLVDFGFAHIGEGEVAMSSMVKGTLGFMPPEQLFNRELTLASDLYGVGATLICLLTKTKSIDIGDLIDANYRIHFRSKTRRLNQELIHWLEKMVEPKPKDRFPDAKTALETLEPLEIRRLPKVKLSHQLINITATEFQQQVSRKIIVQNPVRGTMLTGRFKIVPHPDDPKVKPPGHAWIHISPRRFKGNKVECNITVATRKLQANSTYEREILLQTNASAEPYCLRLKVNTAPFPKKSRLPYGDIFSLFGLSFLLVWGRSIEFMGAMLESIAEINFGILLLLVIWGFFTSSKALHQEEASAKIGTRFGVGIVATAIALITGQLTWARLDQGLAIILLGSMLGSNAGAITEIFSWRFTGNAAGLMAKRLAGAISGMIAGVSIPLYQAELLPNNLGFVIWLLVGMFTGNFRRFSHLRLETRRI
jgi:serine/threonine protein kinase